MIAKSLRIGVIGIRGLPSAYSGLESSCERLYTLLAARGHDITVYCRSEYVKKNPQFYRAIRLRSAPSIRRKSMETLTHIVCSLSHALLRERYDLIHFHAEAPGLLLPVCRRLGIPTVLTVQGLDWQRAKWKGAASATLKKAEQMLARHANEIIVVSRDLQDYFRNHYQRVTHYIPNGVGEPRGIVEEESPVLAEFGIEPGRFVLFLARLVPEKRVEDLISAFKATNTAMKLAIVGEASFTNEYVASLKLLTSDDPRIVFTGFQHRPAVQTLFRNAALYVLPSEMEGLPLSLLECIEAGTPAVVSDIPPHRELLGGVPGYDLFFPPRNVESLRARLMQALGRQTGYRQVAEEARNQIRKDFNWEIIADQTERLYYRTLGTKNPAREESLCES